LFRQARVGFNNRVFMVYKFRTMFHHGDPASLDGSDQARRNDPRITRIGRFLRHYSFDELPQFLNVIKGEMSIVGPRPHPLGTRVGQKLLHDVVDDYTTRHRVLPGITGWAQVNGWRGETVLPTQIEQRVAHDLFYIENWSMALDIRIVMLTIVGEIISKKAF
jgi:lipopolysaccharide/colanic/teichoic acid biosynthesis glycosyltransferase